VRDIWKNLGPKGQLGLVGSGLLVLIVFFFLFRMASAPSYTTLLSGMNPADAGKIGTALDGAGVKYQLKNGGTEIAILAGTESQARVALAEKGLPNGGHVGFESLDKKSFGQTDFQQKVAYQRALEGEIARTIEGISGISSAGVQLVMPEDTLFASEGSKASAAVLLSGGGGIDSATVRGIAHLVSSSVKELSPQNVTITDDTGTLLWPTGDAAGGVGASTKIEAQQRYDSQLSAQINAMLAATLGAGKAQARVHSDLNLDQGTVDRVTYGKQKGAVISQQTDTEGLRARGTSGNVPSGTAANIPSYAQGAGGGNSNSNYNRGSNKTEYGVDKTIERRILAPGAVNKLDVALMVDQTVPAAQVAALRASVAALAGITPARGDTLAVSRIPFAAPAPAPVAKPGLPVPTQFLGPAKWVGIVLAALIFLFMMRRNLRKRENEGVAVEPTWLREIEQAVPLAQLESSMAANRVADPALQQREQIRTEFEELVKTQPDQVAMQVGAWIKEG
jgi:flagellar M-ring protein FliF